MTDLPLDQKARDIARGELVLEVPAHGDDDELGEEMAAFEELSSRLDRLLILPDFQPPDR